MSEFTEKTMRCGIWYSETSSLFTLHPPGTPQVVDNCKKSQLGYTHSLHWIETNIQGWHPYHTMAAGGSTIWCPRCWVRASHWTRPASKGCQSFKKQQENVISQKKHAFSSCWRFQKQQTSVTLKGFFELYIIYRLDNHPKAQLSCLKHCNWVVYTSPCAFGFAFNWNNRTLKVSYASWSVGVSMSLEVTVNKISSKSWLLILCFGSWLNKACDIWHGTAGYLISWFSCDRNQSLVKMFQSTRIVPQKGPFCSPLFPVRFCIERDT